jgi:hypothetical protein
MTGSTTEPSPLFFARVAGFLYLVIIIFGISGEMFVRSGLIVPGDATATAGNILASQGLFRFGFVADSIMFLSDVALAVLLYFLLKPVSKVAALVALCFRLAQTAVLALNLLHYHAAMLLLNDSAYSAAFGTNQLNALTHFFLDMHGHGYDLGLLLFGLHCLLLGYLVFKSRYLPRTLGVLMVCAGFTYLIGSYTRFIFPNYVTAVSPIYGVAIVAELSICLWLLVKGVNMQHWKKMKQALTSAGQQL